MSKMAKKKFIIITLLIFIGLLSMPKAYAQIGVNNENPDPYAILDMVATNKGMLIPRITTVQRVDIIATCDVSCNGLIVFDTDIKAFFYMLNTSWYLLNPWISPDANQGIAEDMQDNTILVRNVGIGISPDAANKLDINGKARIRNGVDVSSGNVHAATGNISTVTGNISSTGGGNITTVSGNIYTNNGHISNNGFSSNTAAQGVTGPIPKGAVILWSGSAASIPSGWALCDGANGTPNLRDRFVVGAGLSYSTGQTGGASQVTLSLAQLPSHGHAVTTTTDGNHWHRTGGSHEWSAYGFGSTQVIRNDNIGNGHCPYTAWEGDHSHAVVTSMKGGGGSHENLPPYFVLCYIMKL